MANIESEWALEKLEALRRGLGRGRSLSPLAAGEALEKSIEGFRLYEQGRYTEARTVFRALCQKEPDQAFARAALGLVHLAMDALPEAERELSRSIDLSDREPSAFITRGEVYLRLARYDVAAMDFERAVKLIPERQDPLARRARLLASTAREMLAITSKRPAPGRVARKRKAAVAPKARAKTPARRAGKSRRK